jgi:hypothetical protein
MPQLGPGLRRVDMDAAADFETHRLAAEIMDVADEEISGRSTRWPSNHNQDSLLSVGVVESFRV